MTRDFPKPLLTVGERPVIDYLVDQIVDLPELWNMHIVGLAGRRVELQLGEREE